MIWIILAILAAGWMVAYAVGERTKAEASRAEAEKLELEEKRKQEEVSLEYLHHLRELLGYECDIAVYKLKLLAVEHGIKISPPTDIQQYLATVPDDSDEHFLRNMHVEGNYDSSKFNPTYYAGAGNMALLFHRLNHNRQIV